MDWIVQNTNEVLNEGRGRNMHMVYRDIYNTESMGRRKNKFLKFFASSHTLVLLVQDYNTGTEWHPYHLAEEIAISYNDICKAGTCNILATHPK
jgi:hypothetical protein